MSILSTLRTNHEPSRVRRACGARTSRNKFRCFRRPQLDRGHFFFPPSSGDGCAADSTEVAHPVDFAEGADHPSPAGVLSDCYRRGAKQAAFTAANGDEHIGTHGDANRQEWLGDVIEEWDPA